MPRPVRRALRRGLTHLRRRGGALMVAAGACLASCTTQHYEGPPLPPEQLAVINTGTAVVRQIDGQARRGGAFDVNRFEVAPGPHHLALVFALPARSIGLKSLPAQAGIGTCLLDFNAEAGKQYYLGSRASGEPNDPHWNGKWEGWVRDPTLSAEDDVIARCVGQQIEPTATPAPTAVAAPVATAPMPSGASPAPAAPPAAAASPPPAGVAAPPPPVPVLAPTTPPHGTAIRIGAWDLRANRTPEQTIARIAAAIDAHFDIVSITVIPAADGQADADALLSALTPGWSALRTTTPPPGTTAGAFYAVLYRGERTQPCSGWEALRYVPERAGAAAASNAARQCFEAEVVDLGGFDVLPVVVRLRGARGSE